jgi:crossover junction endodeoxyribonuclease RusA
MVKLSLPVPPSVNAMYRNVAGRGRVKTAAYKRWVRDADSHYLMQKPRLRPIVGEYELSIRLPKATRGDVDNRVKAVADYLVSREITADDRHCQKITVQRAADTWLCEVEIMGAKA